MHCFSLVEMFPLSSIFFNMESMAMLKRVADSGSTCLTPVYTSNLSVNSLFIFTIVFVPVSVSAMSFCSFPGCPAHYQPVTWDLLCVLLN